MVIRASGPIPQMREAFFECVVCAHTTLVPVERGNVREPASCPHCQNGHTFQLIHNRARFDDKQLVKVLLLTHFLLYNVYKLYYYTLLIKLFNKFALFAYALCSNLHACISL